MDFLQSQYVTDAFNIIKKISKFNGSIFIENPSMIIYPVCGILLLLFVELKQEYYKGTFSFFHNKNWMIRNLSYTFLIVLILLFGVFDGGQFIYFQF